MSSTLEGLRRVLSGKGLVLVKVPRVCTVDRLLWLHSSQQDPSCCASCVLRPMLRRKTRNFDCVLIPARVLDAAGKTIAQLVCVTEFALCAKLHPKAQAPLPLTTIETNNELAFPHELYCISRSLGHGIKSLTINFSLPTLGSTKE